MGLRCSAAGRGKRGRPLRALHVAELRHTVHSPQFLVRMAPSHALQSDAWLGATSSRLARSHQGLGGRLPRAL